MSPQIEGSDFPERIRASTLVRFGLFGLYVVFVAASVFLVKASIGPAPIRLIVLTAGLAILLVIHGRAASAAFDMTRHVLALAVVLTVVGFAISGLNETEVSVSFGYFQRFILQSMLTVLFLAGMVILFGPRIVGLTFVLAIALSCVIATGQFLKLASFWQIREAISGFQDEIVFMARTLKLQDRAMGLSLTPIHLSYQVSLAYAIVKMLAIARRISKLTELCLTAVLVIGAIASGNRSALLGIALNEPLLMAIRRDKLLLIGMPVAAAAGIWMLTSSLDVRALTVVDGSALGRLPLAVLGVSLVLDNPMGYGWGFDTREIAFLYWTAIEDFANSTQAERFALHNYFLNFLVTYGVAILPLLFIIAIGSWREMLLFVLMSLGYWINILTHNSGPFFGDNFFWFTLIVYLALRPKLRSEIFREGTSRRIVSPVSA
jgi:hypothetical protein